MKRKAGLSLYEMFGLRPYSSNKQDRNASGTQPQMSSKGVGGRGGKTNAQSLSSYDSVNTTSSKPTFWQKYPVPDRDS